MSIVLNSFVFCLKNKFKQSLKVRQFTLEDIEYKVQKKVPQKAGPEILNDIIV